MAPHRDIELNTLNTFKLKEESLAQGSSYSMREPDYDDILSPRHFQRFLDSFKRDPTSTFFPSDHLSQLESNAGREHDGAHYYDLRLATLETAHSGLARKLKGRHLQMIAIGGSIGGLLRLVPDAWRLTDIASQERVCSWPPESPWLLGDPRPCFSPSPSLAPCCTAPVRPWASWPSYSPLLVPSRPGPRVFWIPHGALPWAGSTYNIPLSWSNKPGADNFPAMPCNG